MRKIITAAWLTMLGFMVFPAALQAQRLKPVMEVDFQTWFDNREYKSDLTPDQTLFGLMVTPELGLQWEGRHSLMFGTNLTVDFGNRGRERDPEFIVYYNYRGERFNAYAGVFPRRKVLGDYPSLFFSDSVRYYDSNMEGALFQYRGRRGYVELACDWLSMMSDTEREKFVIFSSGKLVTENRKFFAGYYASMFHHSVSYTEDGVTDNLLFYPNVGVDLTGLRRGNLYKIMFKLGWVQGLQRDRKHENKFLNPGGLQAELRLEKWKLGIYNTLYCGGNLMPYYDRYGPGLYMGDAFYRTDGDVYDRLELYWNPVHNERMDLKISSVHHYDGKRWGWQQLITLAINLNGNNMRW